MANSQVLIVGAGPTGLVMALWLARLGVPFRIIDKHSDRDRLLVQWRSMRGPSSFIVN